MVNVLTFVVAVLAGAGCAWLLTRTPPFLSSSSGLGTLQSGDPGERRLRQYASWFVHMRWVGALLSLVLISLSSLFEFLPRETLVPLLLTVSAVAASNLVFPRLAGRRGVRGALALQLYADLGFLILMLHLSGGIENPLYLLPVFNVLLGGIVLTRRQSFMLAGAGGLACAAAVCAEWGHLIPHYTLRIVPHGEHGDLHEAYDALYVAARTAGKLAHEINNPIAIVSAKGRILLSDRRAEMSGKVAHEVERIVGLADRVAGIARGLLAYGRPSAAPRARIDLHAPVRRALSLVEEQASRQGVRLVDEMRGPAPCVEASATEMEQVFLNLFLNALDAMPEGGVLAVSGLGPAPGDGGPAVVVVSDTGPGIPEDLRERAFEPFFTTKEEGRGSGLGLSVCQGIVRAHGGDIDVESGSGHGARFVVRLPALVAGPGEADHG